MPPGGRCAPAGRRAPGGAAGPRAAAGGRGEAPGEVSGGGRQLHTPAPDAGKNPAAGGAGAAPVPGGDDGPPGRGGAARFYIAKAGAFSGPRFIKNNAIRTPKER